jgi:hypothetical protein
MYLAVSINIFEFQHSKMEMKFVSIFGAFSAHLCYLEKN